MSYMAANVLIVNVLIIPILLTLWWQVGWKHWPVVLLVILSYPLLDIDHYVLTNVSGLGAEAMPDQKILHVFHTAEFLIFVLVLIVVSYFKTSRRRARDFRAWLFPVSSGYTRTTKYYLAWSSRILLFGLAIHLLIDIFIYTVHHKWDHLYLSVIGYFLNPT